MSSDDDHSTGSEMAVHGGRMARAIFAMLAFLGLATSVVGVYTLVVESIVVEFVAILLGTVDNRFRAAWMLLIYGPIVSGALVMLLSGLAKVKSTLTIHQTRRLDAMLNRVFCFNIQERCVKSCGSTNKGLLRAAACFLAIVFVIQMALASAYLFALNSIERGIENRANVEEPLTDVEAALTTVQLSIFNLCCEEEGWSAQGKIELCPSDGSKPTCALPVETQAYGEMLCTCYESTLYPEFYSSLARTGRVCDILSEAVVSLSNTDKIPGTSFPISAFVPVTEARIVGFNGDAPRDGTTSDLPEGHGCGFGGYARAFQWMQYRYAERRSRNVTIVYLFIFLLQLSLVLILACVFQDSDDEDFFDEIAGEMELPPAWRRVAPAGV